MTDDSNTDKPMGGRSWHTYRDEYRSREMQIVAEWVLAGESGTVVGLQGCGRSNFLGFLCHRPDVLRSYLPDPSLSIAFVFADMHDLLETDLSMFYRLVIRSCHRASQEYDDELKREIGMIYEKTLGEQDSFIAQSALQDLLILYQSRQVRVVLVLNYFDYFCQIASLQMVNAIRSLRDGFKNTLSYIVGMSQEVAYLSETVALGDMYEILDSHICWLGTMNHEDAKDLICRATGKRSVTPDEADMAKMMALTGGFPSLLRATCYWWTSTNNKPLAHKWAEALLRERSVQHRLSQLWTRLTQEEQFVLSEVQKIEEVVSRAENASQAVPELGTKHLDTLERLVEKGLCSQVDQGWRLSGELLARYVAEVENRGRGKIWLDEATGEIYQEQASLAELTALEREVLTFLLRNPYSKHTKTDLIVNTWPDELRQKGVSDNSLYQVILLIRRAIEPNPSKPRYLVTWRGKPEGGYQFYPEGRPG